MYKWIEEMDELAARDDHHNQCRALMAQYESEFSRIREKLTAPEREALDLYIGACEEFHYSYIYPAYELGRKHAAAVTGSQ